MHESWCGLGASAFRFVARENRCTLFRIVLQAAIAAFGFTAGTARKAMARRHGLVAHFPG
jgi:hypothetical protein